MKPVLIAVLCALGILQTGPARRLAPSRTAPPPQPQAAQLEELRSRLGITVKLYHAARFREAEEQSAHLIAAALRAGDTRTATRATGNVGAMRFALHQYSAAMASFIEARRMAVAMGDASEAAAMDANLCSLYLEMGGDLEDAARRIENVLDRLSGDERSEHLAQTQTLLGIVRARQGRMSEALPLFRDAIRGAEARSDWNLAAFAWNRIGEEYLGLSQPSRAEPALLEAWRIRLLRNLPAATSLRNLGRLRLEQGDPRTAEELLDRAVDLSAQPQGPIPTWDVYHYRGRARLAQGRLGEALGDLRTAVRLARAWRWSAAADDAVRIGAEGWLDPVYGALVEAENRLYERSGDAALARQSFEAAEENRASSLRTLVEGRSAAAEEMPAAYWPAVAQLQSAEVKAARLGTLEAEDDARAARDAVAAMESQAVGAHWPRPTGCWPGCVRAWKRTTRSSHFIWAKRIPGCGPSPRTA